MIFWISKSTSEFYYRILMNLLLNTYIIVSTVSKICMRMDIYLYEIAFESGLPVFNIDIIVRIVQRTLYGPYQTFCQKARFK